MGSRQRGTGVTAASPRQTNRPVYEDFNPKIDTNENEGARIVVLHVPGFLKEQLRIQSEHSNNIRVQGQRPLSNNKWSRFNQVLPVPTNCEFTKIHAKYHSGILTITMPKEVPRTIAPRTAEKPAEKTTQENISDTPPTKAAESKTVPPTASEPNQKAAAAAEQSALKGNEKALQTASKDESKATGVEKTSQKTSFEEHKAGKNLGGTSQTVDSAAERNVKMMDHSPSPQKGHEVEGNAKENVTGGEAKVLDLAARKASNEPKAEKSPEVASSSQSNAEIKNAHEMVKKPKAGEKVVATESTQKGKESAEAPSAEVAAGSKDLDDGKKVNKKLVSDAANEKKPGEEAGKATDGNKLGIKYMAETAKQKMANVVKRLNDDDRQILINIGAAVMVLVALGAYISFGNFGSPTENEN